MSQTEINRKIQIMFFENADAAQIRSIIGEQFTSGSLQDVIDTLNCILDAQLSMLQFEAVISALEDQFLINHLDFLCKYLFVLNDRYGKEHMARFYLDLCNTTQYLPPFYDEEDFNQRVKKYAHPDRVCFSSKYYKNDFNQEYIFEGKSKSYSVYSFSDEIGQNLTLLTTPYGDIIFDCGAKYNKDGAQVICKEEFLRFLSMSNSSVGNIIAVIISHAHMDHYGSLSTLINSGINPHIVFIGEETRQLISVAAKDMISLMDTRSLESFFVANNKIKIEAFANGHILGSEGYIVSFDNINIVYTGDYCLHDQNTVKGLNPVNIGNHRLVKQYGVDCLITESTYGDSLRYLDHASAELVLRHFVSKLLLLGYKVLFPAFAIGRSQEIVLLVNDQYNTLLDGLSVKISHEYEHLTGVSIFNQNTRYSTANEDKTCNLACNDIIIASSGMLAQSSTSSNYVESLLTSNEKTAILITGYMDSTEDSYGNQLLKRWTSQNNVLLYVSLSAHASYDEIVELISAISPRNIVSIHGNGIIHRESSEEKDNSLAKEPPVLSGSTSSAYPTEKSTIVPADTHKIDNEFHDEVPVIHISEDVRSGEHSTTSIHGDAKLIIDNPQLRAKMVNVSKSGQSLISRGSDLTSSQPFLMACKLLVKLLKKEDKYESLTEYLSSLDNCFLFWEYIDECVKNDFSCPVSIDKTAMYENKESQDQFSNYSESDLSSVRNSAEGLCEMCPRIEQKAAPSPIPPKVNKRLLRRIHELAKDLNIRTKDVVAILEHFSIPVKNHMQILSVEECNIVIEYLTQNIQSDENHGQFCLVDDKIVQVKLAGTIGSEIISSTHKQRALSDIMIVKCSESDYYVSEKIAGRDVYLNLLQERAYTSNHYPSSDIARVVAEEKRQSLQKENPECKILEYDIEDFKDMGDSNRKPSSFGTSAISKRLLNSYRITINAIFADYMVLSDKDISCLKGMCNRCIKHDQTDWKTTFEYLGTPDSGVLRSFVRDAKILRDCIRADNYDAVIVFREKYRNLLLTMLHNIENIPTEE